MKSNKQRYNDSLKRNGGNNGGGGGGWIAAFIVLLILLIGLKACGLIFSGQDSGMEGTFNPLSNGIGEQR